ncbi:LuxR C-terminal-related transcriptional regulator [Streptomyces sp. NPDC057302]|uniref:helix-turn-helix transcriptional regulator n=1 Tax=Streptomyces sp. NPDC057302 TaxID=3346094 RepID=UPI0036401DD4
MFAPEREPGVVVPEREYEVVIPAEPGSGGVAAAEADAHRLMGHGFGRLRGRESELALLARLLTQPQERLITLTGPAGVGKSHVAHAALIARTRAGGAPLLWTDLAETADTGAVWSSVGAATAGAAAALIGTRQTLLVLDNCDPVAAHVALDISALLRACPRLKLLVTSRVSLDIRAERVLVVEPLPTGAGSPAEELFADHVSSRHRAALDGAQAQSAVTDLCRELDGIPLAIELAAEAVGTEGPQAVREKLSRGEPIGRRRLRDASARHDGIGSALGWAGQGLSTADRELLRTLAVFEAPLGLAEVRRAAGEGQADAVAGIESLVHQSLLLGGRGPDGEPEFRLPRLARAHYHRDLTGDPDALGAALDRHAAHCTAFAAVLADGLRAGRDMGQLLAAVEARLPDLRKAVGHLRSRGDHAGVLRILTALEGPLLGHGLDLDAADAMEASAAVCADGTLAAEALMAVARWALGRDERPRAEAALDRASAVAAGLPATLARVSAHTGELLRRRGETAGAAALLESALRELDAAGDVYGAALARRSQSLLRAGHGDPDAERPALRALAELPCTPIEQAPGSADFWRDPWSPVVARAALLNALARVRRLLGRAPEAYVNVRESIRLLMGTSGPAEAAEALETMVTVAVGPGNEEHREALAQVLAHAEALRRQHSLVSEEGVALHAVAERLHQGFDPAALRRLRLEARQVSPHSALIAALFAPAPKKEERPAQAGPAAPHGLTPRQHEVALLVAEGMTNRQIGRQLGISEWTVTNHLRVVMQKLECGSRVHVVRAIQQAG